MTPVDCDPVVREVVEDTRAAVEEMMKELNDMVDATPQSPGFQNPKPCMILSQFLGLRWYVLVMTCVWRHENLKRDGSM